MIFASMNLLFEASHGRAIRPYDHKKVFGVKTHWLKCIDDLNMGQVLAIGTDFILTLNNVNAIFF